MEFDLEREKRMYEAMGISTLTNALEGNTAQTDKPRAKFTERTF